MVDAAHPAGAWLHPPSGWEGAEHGSGGGSMSDLKGRSSERKITHEAVRAVRALADRPSRRWRPPHPVDRLVGPSGATRSAIARRSSSPCSDSTMSSRCRARRCCVSSASRPFVSTPTAGPEPPASSASTTAGFSRPAGLAAPCSRRASGRIGVPRRERVEPDGAPVLADPSAEEGPAPADLHVGRVDPPAAACRAAPVPPWASLDPGGGALRPPEDRRVVHSHAAFLEHLGQHAAAHPVLAGASARPAA